MNAESRCRYHVEYRSHALAMRDIAVDGHRIVDMQVDTE